MVKETEFYDLLGVSPDASEGELKKGYRKMAMKLHPDRNPGDETAAAKFQEVQNAFEVLSDEHQRQVYDQYGKKGLEDGPGGMGGGMGGAGSIFEQFFGGGFGGGGFGGGGGGRRGPRKTEDVVHSTVVTLEDLYNGKTSKLRITRRVICSPCKGTGGKDGKKPAQCADCQGRGVKISLQRLGPGMVQQFQSACDACQGTGETHRAGDKCDNCKGRKVVADKEAVTLNIDRGMRHGQKITMYGKADQEPGCEPGDIVFVIQQKEHPTFTRNGDDLYIKQSITLTEALCGFEFIVNHLDGRKLLVQSVPGEVIRPGLVRGVADEGMPVHRSTSKGTLFIQFSVAFPPSMPTDLVENLRQALPSDLAPPKLKYNPKEVEECVLTVDESDRKRKTNTGEAYDSDEEMGDGQQRVQCAQS